jgi:hypothetical protein
VILDTLAGARFSYASGANGTVNVPSGKVVTRIACIATADGATLTITPGGANQTGVAGSSIPVPVEGGWFGLSMLGELGGGTVLVFAGTASYLVTYAAPTN